MAILNRESLLKLAHEQNLFGPESAWEIENFEPSSYDLRVGTIFKNGEIYSVDHTKEEFIKIAPSEIVTMLTLEEVKIPHNCAGTVFAKNSQSSKGLLILNPGHIDPGYEGPITICAVNLSEEDHILFRGKKLLTLVLSKLDAEVPESSRFSNKKEVSRKKLELLFLDQKFKRFSNSIFDLILTNVTSELSQQVQTNIEKKQSEHIIKNSFAIYGILVTLFLGFLAYTFDIFNIHNEEPDINLNYLLQENKELQQKYDTILNIVEGLQVENENLKIINSKSSQDIAIPEKKTDIPKNESSK